MRFYCQSGLSPPPNRFRAYALSSSTPPQGGSDYFHSHRSDPYPESRSENFFKRPSSKKGCLGGTAQVLGRFRLKLLDPEISRRETGQQFRNGFLDDGGERSWARFRPGERERSASRAAWDAGTSSPGSLITSSPEKEQVQVDVTRGPHRLFSHAAPFFARFPEGEASNSLGLTLHSSANTALIKGSCSTGPIGCVRYKDEAPRNVIPGLFRSASCACRIWRTGSPRFAPAPMKARALLLKSPPSRFSRALL